ncbi:DNA polymerase III subunit delta [Omnitrophica bacterium]|nr:DNA polymerase III subunit delta [Candidatus Omnitrophota bacterium]
MVKSEGGVYLFCGEDSFSREEARRRLLSRVLQPGPGELNRDAYDAKDDSADIFNALDTMPFLSGKRVVIINHIEHLSEPKKESFLAYLKNPREHICLVLESSQSALDNKFIKAVSGYAKTFLFKKPTLSGIKGWIYNKLRQHKKTITTDALDLLLELKGTRDLAVLSGELEKLLLYKGDQGSIKQEDVVRLVGKSAVKRAFDLVDAVSAKDSSLALSLVRELSSGAKKAIPETMGLIGWQLRRIWKAKKLLFKGKDRTRICSELKIRSYSVDKFLRQVSCFQVDELKRDFKLLVEADRNIKRGQKRAEFVLEELVVRLCG